MPLLIAIVEFLIGAAILVALAMFVLPIFFFVLGILALFIIGVGVYRTYFSSARTEADFSAFTRGFSSRAAEQDEPGQTTVIEGEYTVVDENNKK